MPTSWAIAASTRPSTFAARMNRRIAASRASERRTGSGSPAAMKLARYSTGIRISSTVGEQALGVELAAVAGSTMLSTGESGGTYQTIGIVRYSGCSGSAIRQRLHIA